MRTADRLLIAALLIVGVKAALNRAEPAQTLPLVKADYSRCVTMHPGPLDKPRRTISGRAPVSELS